MLIPVEIVCRALAAMGERNIRQSEFEEQYHCRFIPHPGAYLVTFDDDKSAVEFLLRFA